MKRLAGFALGTVLCLALASGTMAAEKNFTVGDFAVQMAAAMKLEAPQGGFDAKTASVALREAGVVLEGDLAKALQEDDVVGALSQLGLTLTTSTPDRAVSQTRAADILKTFDGVFATEASTSDKGNNPPGGGFGRGGKKHASPSDG